MTPQEAFQTALAHQRAGRLSEAEAVCRRILEVVPHHPMVLHFLGVIAIQSGQFDAAVEWIGKALAIAPDDAEARFNLAVALNALGRRKDAIAQYRRVVELNPAHADAHYNMATALHALDQPRDAIACYRDAIAARPDFVNAHNNLGVLLQQYGQLDDAIASFARALSLAPAHAESHFNLANAHKQQGRLDDAVAGYRQALAIDPGFAEAMDNLGVALQERGALYDAVAWYRRALALRPNWAETLGNLGTALHELGQFDGALDALLAALQIRETPEIRAGFAQCIADGGFSGAMGDVGVGGDGGVGGVRVGRIRDYVTRALVEAWARPADLANITFHLIKSNPAVAAVMDRAARAWPQRLTQRELFGANGAGLGTIAEDRLFTALLECTPVNGLELERFLTLTRETLLDAAFDDALPRAANGLDENILAFHCALARQCFNNEYVFAQTDNESAKALELRAKLADAVKSNTDISALHLAVVASYFPLTTVEGAAALLERAWPEPIRDLLAQQVREPSEEMTLRTAIEKLTPIDDPVSREVQAQYEQNPYPRWVQCAPALPQTLSFNARLRREFPHTAFKPLSKSDPLDILVAGCGTGQHSIETAQQHPHARILAIDLSLASLGYARRKTRERGIENIEYAQADIMRLDSIDRRFDVIESVGVLHHLQDPLAGWRILLSLLRPGGFMRLGLYSETARAAVVEARKFIALQGFGANAPDIRRCRQALIEAASVTDAADANTAARFAQLSSFRDFFGTSECRDLLFHVQEHRYTLPDLKSCFAALDVNFLGFCLEPGIAARYRERFPGDRTMTDLDCWQRFENENPRTFASMYQFWIQTRN